MMMSTTQENASSQSWVSGRKTLPETDQRTALKESYGNGFLGGLLVGGRPTIDEIGIPEIARAAGNLPGVHRIIFQAIVAAYENGLTIDVTRVNEKLQEAGQLDSVGGAGTAALIWVDGNAAMIGHYIEKLDEIAQFTAAQNYSLKLGLEGITPGSAEQFEKIIDISRPNHDGLTIRTASEILAMEVDEHDCLLGDRLLTKGGRMVIAGPAGLGKSRLLSQLAATSSTGSDWCGMGTHAKGLRWLILQTENGIRRLKEELTAMRKVYGDEWLKNVLFHTLELDTDGFVSFDNERAVSSIENAIRKHKPDIVAADPFRDFIAGDPNSDADMASTVATLGRICRKDNPQRAIVVLHHALTGKAGAARALGYERSGYARNSKVLLSWARAQINVAPGSADNNDSLVLACGKVNDGKAFEPFAVALQESMVYELDHGFDMEQWRVDIGLQQKVPISHQPALVRDLLLRTGQVLKTKLWHEVIDELHCGQDTAYKLINRAKDLGLIKLSADGKFYDAVKTA